MIGTQFQVRYANDLSAEPPAPSNSTVQAHLSARVRDRLRMPQASLQAWTRLWEVVKAS